MNEIVKKGWNLLVANLGIADATRFIVSFERGAGDSVQEIKKFWGGKMIEDISCRDNGSKEKRVDLTITMTNTLEIIYSLRPEFIQEATNAPKLFKDLAKAEHYIAESYKTRSFIVWKGLRPFY